MNEEEENSKDQSLEKVKESRNAEQKIKTALREALTESAYVRLMNVSVVNKNLYLAAAKYLLTSYRRIQRKISEQELINILAALKKQTEIETKITFHSK